MNVANRKERVIDEVIALLNTIIFPRYIKSSDIYLNLVGIRISLKARHLLYLLLAIENTYKIKFPQEYLLNNNFSTIDKIADAIIKLQKEL